MIILFKGIAVKTTVEEIKDSCQLITCQEHTVPVHELRYRFIFENKEEADEFFKKCKDQKTGFVQTDQDLVCYIHNIGHISISTIEIPQERQDNIKELEKEREEIFKKYYTEE